MNVGTMNWNPKKNQNKTKFIDVTFLRLQNMVWKKIPRIFTITIYIFSEYLLLLLAPSTILW